MNTFISTLVTLVAFQGTADHRGAMVMGFDQDKTTHHFLLYEYGGAIYVSVKDTTDAKNRDAIRAHLPHIAAMFGTGDFNAPMTVHDSRNVPGTATMADRGQDRVSVRNRQTARGGRARISRPGTRTLSLPWCTSS